MLNFRGRSLPLCFRPERLGGDRPFALDCCNCCRNVSAAQCPLFCPSGRWPYMIMNTKTAEKSSHSAASVPVPEGPRL